MILRFALRAYERAIVRYLLLLPLAFWHLSSIEGANAKTVTFDPAFASLCHNAIEIASLQTGVPRDVLHAISLTETGRKIGGKFSPWPWTVNMEGAGVWFENQHEAIAFARKNHQRGARSFDVGCFQINYRWHHENFETIEEMFDPVENAIYAARFLVELYHETGSWTKAAGFYHSRTPKFATRYASRFQSNLERIRGTSRPTAPVGLGSQDLPQTTIAKTQVRPKPVWPLKRLGHQAPTEFLSSEPTGSLVRLGGGGSLLTSSSGSLF